MQLFALEEWFWTFQTFSLAKKFFQTFGPASNGRTTPKNSWEFFSHQMFAIYGKYTMLD